ncbi:MAG: F0F1 ATP synthase subunit B [Planctomycetes bacterium]|nr:F0F1 ATP synthase subunit B [Planctomycetota bacterium]
MTKALFTILLTFLQALPLFAAEEGGGHATGLKIPVLVIQTVCFAVLAYVLYRFAWKLISKSLDERAKKIQDTYKHIEDENARLKNLIAEYEQKFAGLEKEAQRLLNEAVKEGEQTGETIVKDANANAEKILAKARREIEIERDKAMMEIREEAVNLTMQAAEEVLKKNMNADMNSKLVADFIRTIDKVEMK